jgi:eukaryotic-like serine/threonine-protein kinase
MMAREFDVAELDTHLERLLDLSLSERELRLLDMARTEPDLAAVLRKVLRIAADVHTVDLRGVGESVRLISEDAPPPQIEGYRLLGEIGRGGMAAVFSAVRNVHGTEQTVAIKVLRAVLLSPAERERFLNEQRILARLQHPNIATLLDVGIVDERPYMVLELVDGDTIDQRLKPTLADLPAILDAIDKVSDALTLAHQHFVIHRDIKPGNVLVDRQGRIKLIDFGIAKILDSAGGLSADPTLTGNAPLTLRYASPEQLLGKPVGVTSDVYQLGLLLYHLLTGAWPFSESDHDLPGERLRAETLPVPASRRVSDPRLKRALEGDLDSILLKCLRRDPVQRYGSVAELRDDLQRHREHRPVRARRQTRGYVLRSFLARHRLGVALGAASILLVIIVVVATLGLAARSREYAQRTERILETVAGMFASANPYSTNPEKATVGTVVRSASRRFLAQDDPDPLFQVLMLERLAELQRAIRDYSLEGELLLRADGVAERAGLDPEVRSRLQVQLAESAFSRGELVEADRRSSSGDTALTPMDRSKMQYVQAKLMIEREQFAPAESVFAELFQALGTDTFPHLFAHTVHNSYGILKRRQGDFDAAIAAYRKALEFLDPDALEDQEALFTVGTNIAVAYGASHRYRESDREFKALLDEASSRMGAAYPQLMPIARNYATLLDLTARYDSAYTLLHRVSAAVAGSDDELGRSAYLDALAVNALYTGHDQEATRAITESMELALSSFGNDPQALKYSLDQLAWILLEIGDVARAGRIANWVIEHVPEPPSRIRTVAALAAELGAGAAPIGSSDLPDSNTCSGAEWGALRARLVHKRAPNPTLVPADCSAPRADRLVALGLVARAAENPHEFAAEPMRSPLARLASAGPESWPATVEPEIAARLDVIYQRLNAPDPVVTGPE